MEFFQKLFPAKAKKPVDITFLIIGPPSCGKTAIIYFMHQFAEYHLTTHGSSSSESSEVQTTVLASINEIELSDFVNGVIRELKTSNDFVGTDPHSITLIRHNTGLFNIKIYNVSGELFSKAEEPETANLLKEFGTHLDKENPANVYTLLCDETVESIGKLGSNIGFFPVLVSLGSKAKAVTMNIKKNINTLRVVTKFDKVYKPSDISNKLSFKAKNFEIINGALSKLNADEMFAMSHETSYTTPEFTSFKPHQNTEFRKCFICTGIYDKRNLMGTTIYETHDTVTSGGGKPGMKDFYAKSPEGRNWLDMYGIYEIFLFALKNRKEFKQRLTPERLNSTEHSITIDVYKRILEV